MLPVFVMLVNMREGFMVRSTRRIHRRQLSWRIRRASVMTPVLLIDPFSLLSCMLVLRDLLYQSLILSLEVF